ncbi:hypothetical protein L596_003372 [Steinernema carpocapsae]|uniref:Uncharacterized protein n=1 Tax=Steinernema carpocapsae TaxID=34508 RepID=A0A4V6I7Q6_STECR|nr:hypothetical protein L596_003372 [Steinernema carpocapsae]
MGSFATIRKHSWTRDLTLHYAKIVNLAIPSPGLALAQTVWYRLVSQVRPRLSKDGSAKLILSRMSSPGSTIARRKNPLGTLDQQSSDAHRFGLGSIFKSFDM